MPDLMYATSSGDLRIRTGIRALGRSGFRIGPPERFVPLPEGATLVHLPGRHPVGASDAGVVERIGAPGDLAVAAVLPPGYLRSWLPAYEEAATASVLPLYGYAAVGAVDGRPVVAAIHTDRWGAWDPRDPARAGVERAITRAGRALPENRLVAHLARCATEYRCLTAQNLFLRDGEGAIPVSPACNAACLGCISEQWGDVDSPQTRLGFAPSAAEIAELAAWHLQSDRRNFVSYGQGCEGEALTRGEVLIDATRRIRSAFPRATIHINTNGSRPGTLQRLLQAGLNSARVSLFSLRDERFRAYYRPVGYGLREIAACADLLHRAGAQLTINLLTFPGITDSREDIEPLIAFIHKHGVHQVQLRSLNVDPTWLLRRIPRGSDGIGMHAFVRELQDRCPKLRLGNFTRPWPNAAGRPGVGADRT
jgi:pyruvate-formate lyase-activating enzyme